MKQTEVDSHFSSFGDFTKINGISVSAVFMKLLDNYERSTGVTERVTTEEQTETNLFLDAVLQTEVMKVHMTCYNKLHLTSHIYFNSSVSCVSFTPPHFLHLFFSSQTQRVFCFPPTVFSLLFSYILWFWGCSWTPVGVLSLPASAQHWTHYFIKSERKKKTSETSVCSCGMLRWPQHSPQRGSLEKCGHAVLVVSGRNTLD